jgi:hypothetical protein
VPNLFVFHIVNGQTNPSAAITIIQGQTTSVVVVYGNDNVGSVATGINLNYTNGACISISPAGYDASDMNGTTSRSTSVNVTGLAPGACSIVTTFSAANAGSVTAATGFNVVVALNEAQAPAPTAIPTAAPEIVPPSPDAPTAAPEIVPPSPEAPTAAPEIVAPEPTSAPTAAAPAAADTPTEAPALPVSSALGSGTPAVSSTNWPLLLVGMLVMLLIGGLRWHEIPKSV